MYDKIRGHLGGAGSESSPQGRNRSRQAMLHLNDTESHLVPGPGGDPEHLKEDTPKPGVPRAVTPFAPVWRLYALYSEWSFQTDLEGIKFKLVGEQYLRKCTECDYN